MNNSIKISVVMLNYNGLPFLKETIPPILNLDYPNFEFVIVDNGSTDGSLEFITNFKNIKLIKNFKNLGYSQGKNIGVKECSGEYILFLDNDVKLISNDILTNLVSHYPTDAAFIQIPLLDFGEQKTYHKGLFISLFNFGFKREAISLDKILNYVDDLTLITAATGGIMFFKRDVWIKLGGLDEIQPFNLDDIDIGSRACIFGYKNYLYTKSYAIHLGVNKVNNPKEHALRIRTLFSGHARSMVKNYTIKNLMVSLPVLFIFHFIKAIRYSIKRRSLSILFSFFYSVLFFLKHFPDTIKSRAVVQSSRISKKDIFLCIRPTKFN